MTTTKQTPPKEGNGSARPHAYIGLDVGSVAVKAVIITEGGQISWYAYQRHRGQPYQAALQLLHESRTAALASANPMEQLLCVTGSSGKTIAHIMGIPFVNEILAQSTATAHLYPAARTIIELGGEDAKLIMLRQGGTIADFSLNSACAAGTGSFLDQQAERLGLTMEQFSDIAYNTEKPARIAGRCSVFSKSDMIHLQQIATPLPKIVAGLCHAVARNFKSVIVKSRRIQTPICFNGGVAYNSGVVKAFRNILGTQDITVPREHAVMGAAGAAIYGLQSGKAATFDINLLKEYIENPPPPAASHPALTRKEPTTHAQKQHHPEGRPDPNKGPDAYLGIDIGSISTNLAVIDDDGHVIAKRYLMTAGNPIEAVRTGLSEIGRELPGTTTIKAVGTTGSGRYMIADYVGADIVKNEITAQATAAAFIDPAVDTVFEIGGQDSKYISLKDGVVVDFEMNKACAAGTGSFLEEQAEKLGISIKDHFAEQAFSSQNPCRLGERCTVFMENSISANLHRGSAKNDLLAGLAYSIVQNYLTKVVGNKKIGRKIFFQGGVAFNDSVVAAFENYLGHQIVVPPHHDVTGAIGMALIARAHIQRKPRPTEFKGFRLADTGYDISSFDCTSCSNVCQINRVRIHGDKKMLFYGARCEKYDHAKKPDNPPEDLFQFREDALFHSHNNRRERSHNPAKPTIGLPYIFFLQDTLPYWTTLLWELGFNVKVSPKTNRDTIRAGIETTLSETCFPVKVAHGHIKALINSGVDAIFLPSFISLNEDRKHYENSLACPLTQAMPYTARILHKAAQFISPALHISRGEEATAKELLRHLKRYGITPKSLDAAMGHAIHEQHSYRHIIRAKGDEVMQGLQGKAIAIIGRTYNSTDPGINLQIPGKIEHLGMRAIPMDLINADIADIKNAWPNMYWRSGQNILAAATAIARNEKIYPLYISSFLCGPDSFILKYFARELRGKPHLNIEIDEHTADAGVITRCEAFIDSISATGTTHKTTQPTTGSTARHHKNTSKHTAINIYVPNMSDHTHLIAAAFNRCGISMSRLPETDHESIDVAKRHASGKECYPYLLTTGDIIKKTKDADFDPNNSAFMMPSGTGPCRFGQYNVLMTKTLEDIGCGHVPIMSPVQDWRLYKDISSYAKEIPAYIWKAVVAGDILAKHLHQSRPYEKQKGSAKNLYDKHLELISQAIRNPRGNIERQIAEMSREFQQLPRNPGRKPIIGIVGEIYVRSNRFANENFIEKIEALGVEAHLSPISEWIHYIGFTGSRKALHNNDLLTTLSFFIRRHMQDKIELQYLDICRKSLNNGHDPHIGTVLRHAAPYIHDSLEGEAILSIGRSVEFARNNTAGIVNLMPFGCMPGSIVSAMLRQVTDNYGIPHISIAYDGTESPVTQIQIEAFVAQAKAYHNDKPRKKRGIIK